MAMASRAQCTRDRVIYYGGPGLPGLPVDPDPGVPGLPVDPPLVCPVSPACDTGHLGQVPGVRDAFEVAFPEGVWPERARHMLPFLVKTTRIPYDKTMKYESSAFTL